MRAGIQSLLFSVLIMLVDGFLQLLNVFLIRIHLCACRIKVTAAVQLLKDLCHVDGTVRAGRDMHLGADGYQGKGCANAASAEQAIRRFGGNDAIRGIGVADECMV